MNEDLIETFAEKGDFLIKKLSPEFSMNLITVLKVEMASMANI